MSQIPGYEQALPGLGANSGTSAAVRSEEIVIVSRTKMTGGTVCIGGIVVGTKESVRLMQPGDSYNPPNAPYQIGEVYRVQFIRPETTIPPHIENIIVQQTVKIGNVGDLKAFILANATPWLGSIHNIYGKLLQPSRKGNMYVCEDMSPHPTESTGFWIPDQPLTYHTSDEHYRYPKPKREVPAWAAAVAALDPDPGLDYVGFQTPLQVIPAGTLVRVSLAKWWDLGGKSPNNKYCFGQLSGWYL